ncbi:hypothetical protein V6Z11_D02G209100 [Gossypium hirsutum]
MHARIPVKLKEIIYLKFLPIEVELKHYIRSLHKKESIRSDLKNNVLLTLIRLNSICLKSLTITLLSLSHNLVVLHSSEFWPCVCITIYIRRAVDVSKEKQLEDDTVTYFITQKNNFWGLILLVELPCLNHNHNIKVKQLTTKTQY